MTKKITDMVGKRYGKLLVISEAEQAGKHRRFLCRCDCGNETIVFMDNLRRDITTNCGCVHNKKCNGYSLSRLYGVWMGMRRRCQDTNPHYTNYHNKNIKVCDSWNNSFIKFREWAYANGYDDSQDRGVCTLDRIDNKGDYESTNCRWVNMKIQSNNKDNNVRISMNGEVRTFQEWIDLYELPRTTIQWRLKKGWSIDDAFNVPVRGHKN